MNSGIYPCHPPAQKKHPIPESKRSWCNPQRIQLSRLRTLHEGKGHWNAALLYRNQELWHLLYEIFRYWLGKGRAPYYPAENCKHTVPSNVCGSRQCHIWLCYRDPPSSEGAYLSADVQHLREYTLSISPFPINGEMLPLVDYFNKIYPVMDDSMEHLSRNLMSALIIGLDKDIG